MLKVNKIFTDPKLTCKAVEAKRERNKRCDDVDNGCYEIVNSQEIFNTYKQQFLAREKYKKRVEIVFWIFVVGLLVIGLFN